MKSVAICSLMRAGSEYEQAYYLQILALSRQTFKIQSVNVVYDTEPTGSAWLQELLRSQGIPVHYGIELKMEGLDPIRQWAARGNQCVELALSHGEGLTHLAWIEADLSYPYDTLEALLARGKPIIAPLIYLNNTFYDSWGYRDLNEVRITQFPPMKPVTEGEPIKLHSVGSFVVFDIAVFRSGIRWRGEYNHGLLVGICEDAAKIGLNTFVDPMISILHPVAAWRQQLWHCKRLQVFADGISVCNAELPPGFVLGNLGEAPVNEWLDQVLGPHFTRTGTRRLSVLRDAAKRTCEIRVDLEPAEGALQRTERRIRMKLMKAPVGSGGIRAKLKIRTRLKRFASGLFKSLHDLRGRS